MKQEVTRQSKRRRIKAEIAIEPEMMKPPSNFLPIYEHVKRMRSKVVAPVDTMGCAEIPKTVSGLQDGPLFRYQLLVSLMLSAQTKDEINCEVMDNLRKTFLSRGYTKGLCVDAIRDCQESELVKLIFKVGFHTRKAKFIKQTTEIIHFQYHDDLPATIEDVVKFPGVGPKMGHLFLQEGWGVTSGIGVDVHMHRLAQMWGWVDPRFKKPTPESTRISLEEWLPKQYWREINPLLVGFGQMICLPRGRRCDICSLATSNICPNIDRKLLKRRGAHKDLLGKVQNVRGSRGDLSALLVDVHGGLEESGNGDGAGVMIEEVTGEKVKEETVKEEIGADGDDLIVKQETENSTENEMDSQKNESVSNPPEVKGPD